MNNRQEPTPEDAEIAELLRGMEARDEPSAEMMRDVQSVVRAEWRTVVAERKRRHVSWALAASVAALGIAAVIASQLIERTPQQVAALVHAIGNVYVADDGNWTRLNEGREIVVGDRIRSDEGSRAALLFKSGLMLRIDSNTAFDVAESNRLALNTGALYIDAMPGKSGTDLTIDTRAGSVRHVGTQYQVRAHESDLEVSVREGRIVLENAAGSNVAEAGERLQVSKDGVVSRDTVSPRDAQWQWTSDATPPFDIEDRALAEFLQWIARETGRTLIFDSPRAEQSAATVKLHGSIAGLAPDVALVAVLETTPLRRHETKDEVIEIGFDTPIDSVAAPRPTP